MKFSILPGSTVGSNEYDPTCEVGTGSFACEPAARGCLLVGVVVRPVARNRLSAGHAFEGSRRIALGLRFAPCDAIDH